MKIPIRYPQSPALNNNHLTLSALFPMFMLLAHTLLVSSCSPGQNASNNLAEDSIHTLPPSGSDTTLSNTLNAPIDSLIVPGVSIGSIKLETDAADVYEKLGKPDAGDAAMGKAVSTWYDNHDITGNALSIYTARDVGNSPTDIIKQVRVTAPGFKTMQGIGPSSTLEEIQTAFNLEKNRGYKINQKNIAVFSDQAGISFEIDEKQQCIGIVVCPTGTLQQDTYFRFLPGITGN